MKKLTSGGPSGGVAYLIVNDVRESTARAQALGGVVMEVGSDMKDNKARHSVIRASTGAMLVLRQKEGLEPAKQAEETTSLLG